ncbi:MAG: DUF2461 domain-containing protein [Bacteroidota bacterium]
MITKAHHTFFRELEENNTKEWFHANKKRYEKEVKAPFLELLTALMPLLTQWDNRIVPDPKKSMFRINRDIRFSKDKSPYHLILKAGFSPNGRKSALPGYYLGIDADHIHVGGGLFMIQGPELYKVRNYISKHTDALLKIVSAKDFTNNFGTLKGEKAKRLDKSLWEVTHKTDLIYNKQFYVMAEFPLEPFFNSTILVEEVIQHFKSVRPLNTYLNAALTKKQGIHNKYIH